MKRIIKLVLVISLIVFIPIFLINFKVPEPINILVVGVDAGDYNNINAPKRTDTIMLVHLETKEKGVYIYSIPRDTRVSLNGEHQKINAVHAVGGIQLLKQKLEDMLNININYFVKIDYKAFRELVDAVGGVDVVIPHDMNYDARDIKIHFKKGEKVHLDGVKAEQFIRWRKNNDGTGYAMGDLGRISTQQEFLVKISEKFKSPLIIFRLPKVMKVISSNIKTDLSKVKIMRYSLYYLGIDKNNIKTKVMSGQPEYINSISYYIAKYNEDYDFLQNFGNIDKTSKRNIKIKILNSTNKNGLAARYKKIFEEKGYDVVEIGNYNKRFNKTVIYCYDEEISKEIKDILDCENVKLVKDNNEIIVVILGTDIVK